MNCNEEALLFIIARQLCKLNNDEEDLKNIEYLMESERIRI